MTWKQKKNFEIVVVGRISYANKVEKENFPNDWNWLEWNNGEERVVFYANENIALLACPHLGMELIKLFLIEAHLC